MKLIFQVCTIIFIVLITAGITQAQNKDIKGSSDYPLISRMPDFWIAAYQESEHDSYTFRDEANNKIDIEGHKYFIEYRLNKGGQEPGPLMILKNHENALKKINAEILSLTKKDLYCKVTKEGKEIWIQVHALDRLYRLNIVEREQTVADNKIKPREGISEIEKTAGELGICNFENRCVVQLSFKMIESKDSENYEIKGGESNRIPYKLKCQGCNVFTGTFWAKITGGVLDIKRNPKNPLSLSFEIFRDNEVHKITCMQPPLVMPRGEQAQMDMKLYNWPLIDGYSEQIGVFKYTIHLGKPSN